MYKNKQNTYTTHTKTKTKMTFLSQAIQKKEIQRVKNLILESIEDGYFRILEDTECLMNRVLVEIGGNGDSEYFGEDSDHVFFDHEALCEEMQKKHCHECIVEEVSRGETGTLVYVVMSEKKQ